MRAASVVALVAMSAGAMLVACGEKDQTRTVTLPAKHRYEGTDRPRSGGEPHDLAKVRRINERYGKLLRDRYDGVVGWGVGSIRQHPSPPDADVYVIDVFLASGRYLPRRPQSLKGVTLEFIVTGPVRAQ